MTLGKQLTSSEQFLSPPAVARLLGCNTDKIGRLIRTGELKASNLALTADRPRWKISLADLQDFLDRRANTRQATSAAAPAATPRRKRRIPQAVKKYV
jgi:hypothetical protein